MVKEKRILSYFIGWLIIGICIMFVGISEVFGATYYMNRQYQQQYYNNNGSYVTPVTTSWMESFNSYISGNIPTTANSYGAGLSITSPIPFLANHVYSMSVYFEETNNIALSSKNEISVASSLSAAAEDYANGWPGTEMLYSNVSNNTVLQFVFKVNNNHTHLFFPWTTTTSTTQDYVLTQIVMEDLGSEGVSQNDINNSLNNQTNEINDSIKNSEDNIINNQNQNTEDMIQSQVACSFIDKTNIKTDNYYLNGSGGEVSGNNFGITDYINVLGGKLKLLQVDEYNAYACFYNVNKELISCTATNSLALGEMTIPTNANYARFTINKSTNKPTFELCRNGNQAIVDSQNQMNDILDGIDDSINNSNVDGSLNNAGSFFDNFTTSDHGGLSGIITAPLVAINQMLNTSCSPMTTTFKGKELSLPCGYEFWNKMGPIQDFINLVLGGLLCYQIIIKLYKLIEKIKNPEDDRLEVMDL